MNISFFSNNDRFANIGAQLVEKDYRLYPVSSEDNILWFEYGCFLRAIHQPTRFQEEYCLIFIPNQDFDFVTIAKIHATPELQEFPLYAIERNYIAFAYHNQYDGKDFTILAQRLSQFFLQEQESFKNSKEQVNKKNGKAIQTWFNPVVNTDLKRLAWITDPHFNFLTEERFLEFQENLTKQNFNGILITGDIAESHDVTNYLEELAKNLSFPIYFVLGNHDYYGSSFAKTAEIIKKICRKHPNLFWLTDIESKELTSQTVLLGHEGWADGQYGDFINSDIVMTDYICIEDITTLKLSVLSNKRNLFEKLKILGEKAAQNVRERLIKVLMKYNKVVFITHFPPFLESCIFKGKISNVEWQPHLACQAMGNMLREVMLQYPKKQLLVLCGHTHGMGAIEILPNILTLTGEAVYGKPVIQSVLQIY